MKDFGFLLINIPFMIKSKRKKLISKQFSEKIMLVVTSVNGCTYCEWFHAKMARKSGISNAEVHDLLNSQFNVSMKQDLLKFYGKTKARAIELNIRTIWFGNLSGNTFDAYRSRREGKKAQNSNVIFEFIFYLLSYPILSPLVPILKKRKKILVP